MHLVHSQLLVTVSQMAEEATQTVMTGKHRAFRSILPLLTTSEVGPICS